MDYETLMPVVQAALEKARLNPLNQEPPLPDDYLAWVILNELRRSGFEVQPKSSAS